MVYTAENKETIKVDDEFDQNFDVEYMDGHGNKVGHVAEKSNYLQVNTG